MKQKLIKFYNSLSPLNIILGGLLALTMIVHWSSLQKIKHLQFQETSLPEKVYVDKYGDRHILLKTIELNKIEIDGLKNDKEIQATKIAKLDKLLAKIKITTKVDTFFKTKSFIDSNFNFYAEKKDEWIKLSVKGNKDSAIFKYSSIDTIVYVEYIKRNIFKSNEHIVDIKNTNPYNKINTGSSFKIKETTTYLSAGPQIGWNPINQKLYIGIGVQFNLIPLIKK